MNKLTKEDLFLEIVTDALERALMIAERCAPEFHASEKGQAAQKALANAIRTLALRKPSASNRKRGLLSRCVRRITALALPYTPLKGAVWALVLAAGYLSLCKILKIIP
jgi:hypothetical protein